MQSNSGSSAPHAPIIAAASTIIANVVVFIRES